jgi:hypothetical protein
VSSELDELPFAKKKTAFGCVNKSPGTALPAKLDFVAHNFVFAIFIQ